MDTSAPDGSLRTSNCDEENYFICDIDANSTFNLTTGIIYPSIPCFEVTFEAFLYDLNVLF